MSAPLLEAVAVEKRYGRVVALRGADFAVRAGECVGLVGDNGAGKSTLIKVLSGAVAPDAGRLRFDGADVEFRTPADARRAGIETVYQDLALATTLGAATNIFLGRESLRPGLLGKLGFLDRRSMNERTRELLRGLNVKIQSLEHPVGAYSGGQRQAVAIARAVSHKQRVLILDEPTAALGVAQSTMVLDLIKRVRDQGVTVIFISHNMPHVFAVADRMIVLRHGRRAGTLIPSEATMDQAVSLMTGATAEDYHLGAQA
jgi:ABC-type sugar transport system ATPase subunit